jgi:hypothetical protein
VAVDNYVFVDKTHYLEALELNAERLSVFLRPRRFGKSLFVSLLSHYYDIAQKENFDKLFSKYYIGKNPTPLAHSLYILKFDFSGIDTRNDEATYNGFLEKVKIAVQIFMQKYTVFDKSEQKAILGKNSPELVLNALLGRFSNIKGKIYLIIDEYDHFTNEVLLRDKSTFKDIVSQDGYVRKFYENIKTATGNGIVDRFFITGVSPVTLDSLTSGFNISTNISLNTSYHGLMGFTQHETEDLLDSILEDKTQRCKILEDMKKHYNGYQFHPDAPSQVYNSDMVLYFLREYQKKQAYPDNMLDMNIAPDYGKLKKMFHLLNFTNNWRAAEEILTKGTIAEFPILSFNFEIAFGRKEFINYLFYQGNLTVQGRDIVGQMVFKIPNLVIEELYWQFYADSIQEIYNFEATPERVKPSVLEMAMGNPKPFFDLIQEILQALSNRDYQNFDEKYVKAIIMAFAHQTGIFMILSERETTKSGYTDIAMLVRPNNPSEHAEFVFELKYLKKEDKKQLKKAQKEAKKQLQSYLDGDEMLKTRKNLSAYTVCVVKDEVFLEKI